MTASATGDVFVTGATGFVGGHVLRELLGQGFHVRALVRPGSRALPPLTGCTTVTGDLRRPGDLIASMRGCRYLVHVAALYSFNPARRPDLWATNVGGSAGLLLAAQLAGLERAVITSSSATVGPAHDGRPATEADYAEDDPASPYHRSKLAQERAVLKARLPAVLVLPTAPIGAGDWKPTPTGKMVVDFLRGRIFATLGGGLNVVAVEDVARAHVAALGQGRVGERYLVGGENVSLDTLWQMLGEVARQPAPTRRIPYRLALALGYADSVRCRLAGMDDDAAPLVPLEGVRMARHNMFVRCDKAVAELGYRASPIRGALERAVRWYRDNGYIA